VFTKYPISLVTIGDYLELTYTFTDTTGVLQSSSSATAALFVGLFNSGGVAPQSGTTMANSGFNSALTTAATGGTVNWVGFSSQMYNGSAGWRLYARPVQTTPNNLNQGLLYNYPQTSGNGGLIVPGSPNLIQGTQYTIQFRVTKSSATQLIVSNALYTGTSTSGVLFSNTQWVVSGANLLTTNFDSLAIGYRAGDSIIWTNDINNIAIVANLAAQQAGPYFFVNSTGNPCTGGVDVTLSGSVTTNTYLLYTNGVFTGQTTNGTGSALDFGVQTVPANYAVIASNTVTAGIGAMYGSANVFAPGVSISTQPASVTLVTNLPASFSVTAVGAALSYQWYKNGVAMTNNANTSGATSTTLQFAAAGAGDAASYTVVVQTPCGNIVTSAPPAVLTLLPPRNLIWVGNNPGNAWNYADTNFTLLGSPTNFLDGDNVTFDDSSSVQTVILSNNVTPTLVSVNGTTSYSFGSPNKITGIAQLVDTSSGTLVIANNNDYTGGTIVSNGATLQLGDGTSINGSVKGTVYVYTNGTLQYQLKGPGNNTQVNLNNALAGGGTVNYNDVNGSILSTPPLLMSSNFTGTINVQGFTCLHASDVNVGYALGNGSTVNVPASSQAWLDRSSTAYNNTFNIAGTGWQGATPNTGALRLFGNTVNGPINLLANARIGGTLSASTIQSVISGPYQLEVWGTTNSYVLIMGPTNGAPQAYASTLITAGSIQAANSNAISSGPLIVDIGGDMRLNGNNITVSNLSSINSGSVLLIEGPRVRNMHATTNATLTVGTDDASSQFDGTFSDGAVASFGLTKVGAGTLTLTAVCTNTGAVTVNGGSVAMSGSGSFGKASQIIVNNGGFYDVTGAGGTFTLNSGQTLRGTNGTVNGILVASAGSVVAPGFPMGTLTNSGNATVNGTYRPNLNRNSSPNCSKFTSSGGSITFSGVTLSETNVGPKLQVGDFFQLFAGATAGFTSSALQTNDVPNSANYTWTNTVATDGKITVLSVVSRVPIVQTAPTASAIAYGQVISNSIISGGSVTNSAGAAVAGAFAFVTPTNAPDVGITNQSVTFTPTDLVNYSPITLTLGVTVNKQTPVLKTVPTASTITNGNPLSLSILTGGVVTNAFNTNVIAGTFAFTTPSATPGVGTANQSVTFTPTDPTRYNPITLNVSVTVVAAPSAITALKFTGSPVVSGTNLTISVTNTGAGTFYLLNTTNVASVRNTWKPLWTNVAAGSSGFTTTVTNAVTPALGRQFYILSTTNNQ
jgi:autotransporter-associated beta strand protein